MAVNMIIGADRIVTKSWWDQRTALELVFAVLSVFGLLVSIGLIIGIAVEIKPCSEELIDDRSILSPGHLSTKPSGSKTRRGRSLSSISRDMICVTPECVHTASRILRNMDTNADPCDDFYEFACGSFSKHTPIPEDRQGVDTFSIVDDNLQLQLRESMEEAIKPNESRPFKLAKILYQSCMNTSRIEEQGLNPLFKVMKEYGGWPVLDDDWDADTFDWKDVIYKNRRNGYSRNYFISIYIYEDPKNSTKRMFYLDSASLGLQREHITKGLNDEVVKAYYDYMVDIAVILGANRARATEELRESLNFEISLANMSLPSEKRRNATGLYNPMTVDELSLNYPSIPWLEFFKNLLGPSTRLEPDDVVNVPEPKYISALEELLKRTPKRIQANYAMWRIVKSSIGFLNEEIRKRQLAYSTQLTGKTQRKPRWEECVSLVSSYMYLSVSALYVRKYFNEEAKNNVINIVSDVRKEFRQILEEVDWMDEETRAAAVDKADAMHAHIAYPDELLDDKKLEKQYEKLEITGENLLESVLNYTIHSTLRAFENFREPYNMSNWVTHGDAVVVNAYYYRTNRIRLPAGILQKEFFSKDRPQYMNYGAIGFVIGHEITHGLDDQGSQHDKHGNLVDWWKEETKTKFLEKAQCIIDQYSNYTDHKIGLSLNGVTTQGENIADNGGVKLAYRAYNNWARRNDPEPLLPGLDFTPQQMIWISVASVYCTATRRQATKLHIITDDHSPEKFRVIGPFSNMPEFARDFKCPLGSKMNPVKKCAVW